MLSTSIRSRAARSSDAPGIARLFQQAYGASSHPCRRTEFVESTLRSSGDKWFLLEDDERLLACTGYVHNPWNQTYEVCRSVTLRESQRQGYGRLIYESSLLEVLEMEDADYIFAVPRSLGMYKLMSEGIEPPLVVVGHDGAMNLANGRREYHLLGLIRNPRSISKRIAPAKGRLAGSAFVRERILRPLGAGDQVGPYPRVSVVGENGERCLETSSGRVHYNVAREPGNAVARISAVDTPSEAPREILEAMRSFTEAESDLHHVSVQILADRDELLDLLVRDAWKVSAYLPGWYLEAGRRYDCALLVKSSFSEEPVAHETRALIEELSTELNRPA